MSTPAWLLILAAGAAALTGTGCQRAAPPAPAAGAAGPRVVTLAPNLTELVCAVGAGNRLVGRTSVCNYPPEIVSRVPVVGDFGVPSIERILALKPTVLLETDMADPTTLARLGRTGVAIVHVPCVRLDDIPNALLLIGRNVGRAGEAEVLAAELRRKIAALRSAANSFQGHRPRVYVEIWNDPLSTVGRSSFLAELVRLAGGDNVGDEAEQDYFQVSSEWVVARNPEIVLCFYMGSVSDIQDLIVRRAGWNRLAAVRNHRVFSGFDNDIVLRPGPRVLKGIAALERVIHESVNSRQ